MAERVKHQLVVSPVPLRRKVKEASDASRRMSKTLPRGLGGSTTSSQGSADCDVYGLYGDLMNCREGSEDASGYVHISFVWGPFSHSIFLEVTYGQFCFSFAAGRRVLGSS